MKALVLMRYIFSALLTASLLILPARAADPALIAAAQKEGEVIWYTAFIVNQLVRPASDAFEKLYGVKVKHIRANASDIALRIINEGKAGKVQSDVFDSTTGTAALKKAGMVEKFIPPNVAHFPKEMLDPEGYWVAVNSYILAPAVNTSMIPRDQWPKTLEDFLDPRWQGKIAWSTSLSSGGAPGFIATVIKEYGEAKGMDYLRRLALQKPININAAARRVTDQMIAGEFPLALQIFNNQPVSSARQGAPVAWLPVQPVTASLNGISVTKGAPHPNAARLFVEFMVSAEGQKIVAANDYIPADPDTPAADPDMKPDGKSLRAQYFNPEELEAGMSGWADVFNQLFR